MLVKLLREACLTGQAEAGEVEGVIFALTTDTLLTKNDKKLLQSRVEGTGTTGSGGLTILLIV